MAAQWAWDESLIKKQKKKERKILKPATQEWTEQARP